MKTEVKALFKDFNAGEKKDVLKFELKGDLTDSQLVALHKLKGGQVYIQISSSQMDIDDIDDEEYEGVEYSVGGDGVVNVASNQLSIDDVPKQQEQEDEQGTDEDILPDEGKEEEVEDSNIEENPGLDEVSVAPDNVTTISQERKRRGGPKKTETDPESTAPPVPGDKPNDDPGNTNDDDLPF